MAEIREDENKEAANLVGNGEGILVRPSNLIARVTAQHAASLGLSAVYASYSTSTARRSTSPSSRRWSARPTETAIFSFSESAVMGIFKEDGKLL